LIPAHGPYKEAAISALLVTIQLVVRVELTRN
jgi:hypothetical protein